MFKMKKVFFFLLLLGAPNLFGDYQIKIAVYKDHANLMTYISKIPGKSYRKNIFIKKKNHLHYVTSGLYENKSQANNALTVYKKVFPDAFISEVKQQKAVAVVMVKEKITVPEAAAVVAKAPEPVEEVNQTLVPVEAVTQTPQPAEKEQLTALDTFIVAGIQGKVEPLSTEAEKEEVIVPVSNEVIAKIPEPMGEKQPMIPDTASVEVTQEKAVVIPTEAVKQESAVPVSTEAVSQTPEPIKDVQPTTLDAKILLENKTVYICEEDGAAGTKKEVVKMDFKEDYVVYRKLKRDVPPIHIPYTFEQDCVIVPMSGINFKYQIYQEGQNFLSAQGFIEDKKGHKLRYYFDEDLALEFARHQ
jgi:hypothetical protein